MKVGIVFVWLAGFAMVTSGRLVPLMSVEEMLKRADLVAVARPVSTRDTAESSVLTNISPPIRVLGRETRFQVQKVEKGETNQAEFVMHHYRLADPGLSFSNAPELLDFTGKTNDSFLVYLVREPDGRFAPVCGQTDPAPSVVYVSRLTNSAVERFVGKWRFENGLMGESDALELAPDHTFHWEHSDSVFQPPAVTRLTGTWKQPDEFAYVTLQVLHRVDHQGERVLVDKEQKERINLCLTKQKKLKVFEGAMEFTRVGGINKR